MCTFDLSIVKKNLRTGQNINTREEEQVCGHISNFMSREIKMLYELCMN